MAEQGGDDLERLPGMGVVVLGVQAKPARRRAADLLGQRVAHRSTRSRRRRTTRRSRLRPRSWSPRWRPPGWRDRRCTSTSARAPTGLRRRRHRRRSSSVMSTELGPVDPVVGMLLLDPDITDQEPPREVFSGAVAELSFFRFIDMNCGNCSIVGQTPARKRRIAGAAAWRLASGRTARDRRRASCRGGCRRRRIAARPDSSRGPSALRCGETHPSSLFSARWSSSGP